MNNRIHWCYALVVAALAHPAAAADKLTATFSDPSRPGTLKVSLLSGGMTIKSHAGKDVVLEAVARESKRNEPASGGLRRIPMTATGLTVEEEGNVMRVHSNRGIDLTVLVPERTSLQLRAVNGGDIAVEGVEGEMDIDNVNGSVTMTNVAGSAVAHALNGKLTASFRKVDPQKPMSFSSLNGTIDVTLPAATKANLKMTTENGEVMSDFDVTMSAAPAKVITQEERKAGGRYRVQLDKSVSGTINGGGPSFEFKNFNGNIYIRKAK